MDREEIIRMVATYRPREAGISDSHAFGMFDFLEHFAALVAAAEREKVAQWMTRQGYTTGHGDTIEDLLKELEWQIEDRIKNIIRAKPEKPSRLFGLKAGDNFILRRNKEKYTLVKVKWTPGMGAQYICQNLKTGETVRLHHSVLVEPDNIQESSK